MKDYVAFDLETTGLSPDSDQIIEIGAVKIRDGKISGKYNCIIHPEIEVSDFIINLTGISRDMLRKGIPLKEGVEEFLEFSGDLPWIWLVNIDHLYWVKDGLQVAEQKLHPHGHGWSIVNNVDQWTWK